MRARAVFTFPCLVHGPRVSAALALVVHPKRPHLPALGEDAGVGLSHGYLSYKVTLQVRHLTWSWGKEKGVSWNILMASSAKCVLIRKEKCRF